MVLEKRKRREGKERRRAGRRGKQRKNEHLSFSLPLSFPFL